MVFESLLGTPCPFSQGPHQRWGTREGKKKEQGDKGNKGKRGREGIFHRMKKTEQTRVTCPPKAQSTALGNQFQ